MEHCAWENYDFLSGIDCMYGNIELCKNYTKVTRGDAVDAVDVIDAVDAVE